ncbi:MAG: histidine phosphatase family protein [Aquificaceae bacterium]|nr:histidine phosphatase family protein [Aquificaceae bacterium]MDW8237854.1 histidine phosphatase family protein [Aquificaceae bacterium]
MVRLFVIRHAQSSFNLEGRYQGRLDPGLTELGRLQANAIARHLKEYPIKTIYTSPLSRTYDTALAIAKELSLEPIPDERLIEIDHGIWSGMLIDEVQSRFEKDFNLWLNSPHEVHFQNGESLKEVERRIVDMLNHLRLNHDGENVALVTHSVPMRVLYCAVLGIGLDKFWSFGCDNACYSLIDLYDERSVIIKLNVTCHLGELYVEAHRAI